VAKSKKHLDISVLIATYNRADILRQTLENMTCLDRDGLSVEFVVVDNNSSDHTKEVIESFTDRLPIFYLFESRPGKNCALNKALNEVPLGKLVVFTDDDVKPKKDWLKAIIAITNRWPDYKVFGGKQFLIYPEVEIPKWASSKVVMEIAFGWHDYGDKERPYSPNTFPFGANFWVRGEIFEDNKRFNESIGPQPGSYIMGSEISFLRSLSEEGYRIVYSPNAVVGHCVCPNQISRLNILRRAYRCGRQGPHIGGLCRRKLFQKHPIFWLLIRVGIIIKASFGCIRGMVCLSTLRGIEMKIASLINIGYNIESIKLAWGKIRK
jgi:glycosyltransferase involved in cell wall biosynthesis